MSGRVRATATALAGVAAAFGAAAVGGCAATSPRLARHVAWEPWFGAARSAALDPATSIPLAALVAATPILHGHDESLLDDASMDGPDLDGLFADDLSDDLTIALVAVPSLWAIGRGVGVAAGRSPGESGGLADRGSSDVPVGGVFGGGDGFRAAEVVLETLLLDTLVVTAWKSARDRVRPDERGSHSFPSSHASLAFAGATLLARMPTAYGGDGRAAAKPSPWWNLAYVPAAVAAYARVEERHHFPSDVAAGAAIGFASAQLVIRAHAGSPGEPGIFGLPPADVTVLPVGPEGSAGVTVSIRF